MSLSETRITLAELTKRLEEDLNLVMEEDIDDLHFELDIAKHSLKNERKEESELSKDHQEVQKREAAFDDLLSDPFGENGIPSPEERPKKEEQQIRLVDVLPEENKEKAFQLASQIDPKNMQSIVLYGSQAQSKLLNFSHSMIDHVQKKDVGEVGVILGELMKKLEQVNPDDLQSKKKRFLSRMFGKVSNSVQEVLSRYQKQVCRLTESA